MQQFMCANQIIGLAQPYNHLTEYHLTMCRCYTFFRKWSVIVYSPRMKQAAIFVGKKNQRENFIVESREG